MHSCYGRPRQDFRSAGGSQRLSHSNCIPNMMWGVASPTQFDQRGYTDLDIQPMLAMVIGKARRTRRRPRRHWRQPLSPTPPVDQAYSAASPPPATQAGTGGAYTPEAAQANSSLPSRDTSQAPEARPQARIGSVSAAAEGAGQITGMCPGLVEAGCEGCIVFLFVRSPGPCEEYERVCSMSLHCAGSRSLTCVECDA